MEGLGDLLMQYLQASLFCVTLKVLPMCLNCCSPLPVSQLPVAPKEVVGYPSHKDLPLAVAHRC